MDYQAVEVLVRQCQRTLPGDTYAFEQLVALFKQRVFSITYRMMGSTDEAEDQAQEVFLKVYRNIHSLSEPATFPAWITRIATNTCLDALTRQQRRPRTTPLEPIHDDGDSEVNIPDTRLPTPEDAALHQELRTCLEETLVNMEPTARAVIVLRDIEDRPYQEIADTLSLGLSAVKMRIHRARLLFQQVLERICPDAAKTIRREASSVS